MGYVDLGIKLLGWVLTLIQGGGAFEDTIKAALGKLQAAHAEGKNLSADDVHQVALDCVAINADTQAENPSTHEDFKL